MKIQIASVIVAGVFAASAAAAPLHFEREKIGNTIYESAGVMDVNQDGTLDIVSGGVWYEGPDFEKEHKVSTLFRSGDYYDNFSDYPMDVDGDGDLDLIGGGWWNKALVWRENPGNGEVEEWKTHKVADVGNIERNVFADLDGDGTAEVMPVTKPVHIFKLKTDDSGKGTGAFEQYTINKGTGGHGFGAGDINDDGKVDLVLPGGWIEAPDDPFDADAWQWHQTFEFGSASVPILVHDVNEDGKADVIVGQAHPYGLHWYEQTGDPTESASWREHVIDEHRSQYHDMRLADIDNDGDEELITGKRFRAHMGHDPGADEPLGFYYYDINGGDFVRHTIDYGPADIASGAGIFFWVADVDENGWLDIVAPGKEGLHLFRNQGPLEMVRAN